MCGISHAADDPPNAPLPIGRRPRSGMVAMRVELTNAPEWSTKLMTVDQGTRAILFGAEAAIGDVLEAGTHSLTELGKRSYVIAVIVDAGEVPVVFTVPGLFAEGGVEVALQCEVAVRVVDPAVFFTEFMRQQRIIARHDVADAHATDVLEALAEITPFTSYDNLVSDAFIQDAVERALYTHLRTTLARDGLDVIHIRALEIFRPGVLEERRERLLPQASQARAEILDERARVRERLAFPRELGRLAAMRDGDDLRAIRRELDGGRVLDDAEWQSMLSAARAAGNDPERAPRHILRVLQENQSWDLTLRGLKQERQAERLRQEFHDARDEGSLGRERADDVADEEEFERRLDEHHIYKTLVESQRHLTPEQVASFREADTPEAAEELQEEFDDESHDRLARDPHAGPEWRQRGGPGDEFEDLCRIAAEPDHPEEGPSAKSCPSCGADNFLAARHCATCGFRFPD